MSTSNPSAPFDIYGIELLSFAIHPQGDVFPAQPCAFSVHQELKARPEKGLVVVFTGITIKAGGDGAPLASLEVATGFTITGFETTLQQNSEGYFVIPLALNTAICQVASDTARGILFSQLRGTYLQNCILPLQHPASAVSNF